MAGGRRGVGWPPGELEVDEALVRALLAEQHPDLGGLGLAEQAAGWDNVLWRLGDSLLVRLPRRAVAATLTASEQRWLPLLAPRLPVPVPAPLRVGLPGERFPWPWSVVPWLPGVPADRADLSDPEGLGRFLRALHRPAPADAPVNPFRSVALAARTPAFEARIEELAAHIDVVGLRRVWDHALAAAPWPGPPLWLHGDLHPANVLVADGRLVAVLDFGDVCAGDPATDLAAGPMLLSGPALAGFDAAYGGVDEDTERRSLGWAALFGLMLLSIGLDNKPTYTVGGRRALANSVAIDRRLGGAR